MKMCIRDRSKGKSGKHLTGTVIYGYLWDEARDQWLVDPEAAEVVKRIFAMTIEGYGPYQIASKLKEEKVLIPVSYTHLDVYKRQPLCCLTTCASAARTAIRSSLWTRSCRRCS